MTCMEHDAANVKFFTHYTGKQLYNTKSNNILLQILLHNPCKYCPIFAMNETTVYKNRVRTYITCLCSVQNRVSIFTAVSCVSYVFRLCNHKIFLPWNFWCTYLVLCIYYFKIISTVWHKNFTVIKFYGLPFNCLD